MMLRFQSFLRETAQARDVIPPLPGKSPIPPNTVRRFHVTRANPDVIRREGLRMSAAKGIEGPRAIYGWSTYKDAYHYSGGGEAPIVEYYISKQDAEYHPTAVAHDISPRDIVAIHEKWHDIYRYAVAEHLTSDDLRGIDATHDRARDVLRKHGR